MAKCPDELVYGANLTSKWRNTNLGKAAGGGKTSKAEEYQRKAVEDGTDIKCPKTNYRINIRKNTIEKLSNPLSKENGFDYTEDFDGVQDTSYGFVFISFKCVCKPPAGGGGGSQTRTLRDQCYHFVEAQLKFLVKHNKNIFFANILDGDEADKRMKNFKYLLALPEYAHIAHKVYVGNLGGYFDWFNKCATIE
jgi:hypothetical protein